jgi:pyrroloquinoline-quinone synthase
MQMDDFLQKLTDIIWERRKITSPLYQVIMNGEATLRLLQNFVIHRYPIKNLWVRHVMSVGSRIEDHKLRRLFVENAYEEETGAYSNSDRHVQTFLTFGEYLGVPAETVVNTPMLPETKALVDFNLNACNNTNVPISDGAASVLLLMEGQPPIVNKKGNSMESVMRDAYKLPQKAYEFFTHHASSNVNKEYVSDLEDTHTSAVVEVLRRYCTTDELQQSAIRSLETSIDLRHKHFNALYEKFYDPSEPVFRYSELRAEAAHGD